MAQTLSSKSWVLSHLGRVSQSRGTQESWGAKGRGELGGGAGVNLGARALSVGGTHLISAQIFIHQLFKLSLAGLSLLHYNTV